MMPHIDNMNPKPRPLQGIRILDLTTVLAGPYCTYQLALLGAEVIKVERPDHGDWARNGTRVTGLPEFSTQFVAQNAGKKSVTLDLKSERGRAIALKLAATCDILVENYSPGVAHRLGMGYEDIRKYRPDVVYCSLSGYGQNGPMSRRPAYDHVIQAASGITTLIGTEQTAPNRIGPPVFDYLAGIYAAFSVMAALRERERTGSAQLVDVAMLDAGMVAMAATVSNLLNGGLSPRPNGNTAASGSPASGIFKTRDGLLSLTANNEPQIARLCKEAGIEHLLHDERYAQTADRLAHADAFRAELATALLRRTATEWEQQLSAAHIPAARVRTVDETLNEPQIEQRGIRQQVMDAASGKTLQVPSIGFLWNEQAVGPDAGPPRLGEHTDDILAALGLLPAEIAALHQDGVV